MTVQSQQIMLNPDQIVPPQPAKGEDPIYGTGIWRVRIQIFLREEFAITLRLMDR